MRHPLFARQACLGQTTDEKRHSAPQPTGRVSPLDRTMLRCLLDALGRPPLNVVLWDGRALSAEIAPLPRVQIATRATLWQLALDPLYAFGEAYSDGRLRVEGDLAQVLAIVNRPINTSLSRGRHVGPVSQWLHRPRSHTLMRSWWNIHQHYDIGNDFYELWLDDRMVYTCAYFADPNGSLEQAQTAKLDHVCRKLQLRPGECVMEAGCGWGALALHMARHYGVRVKAYNISREQIHYARQRAWHEGLQEQVEFIEEDWRNMRGTCDAFVSVGMLEHVGLMNYARLGEVIRRCLQPSGRGLIHSIGQNWHRPTNPWIERHIFPGGYPPTLAEAMNVFEPHDFAVQDVENLRLHYAKTLRHWRARFEDAVEVVRRRFDDRFVRMWRLYLCGSIAAFEMGSLQLFQIVFTPGPNNNLPWTREELYATGKTSPQGNDREVSLGVSADR